MANTKRMTITEGLVELKLYDNKISKAIADARLIDIKKKKDNKIGTMLVDNYEKRAKESYQSILDMMKNRDAIKRAIVLSNATTQVTINGKTMTVAEAIEKRNLNDNMGFLLGKMETSLSNVENQLTSRNADVDTAAEKLLVSYYGKDAAKKVSKEDYDSVVTPYKEANEWVIVDPLNLREKYEKLREETDGFMSTVDSALSISNATTFIEIEV